MPPRRTATPVKKAKVSKEQAKVVAKAKPKKVSKQAAATKAKAIVQKQPPAPPKKANPPPTTTAAPAKDTKIVTQIKKGRAAVDVECPRAKTCHVYDDQTRVWTATLNQTNLGKNANKYYIIQLLQSDTAANEYWVWNRWGRVGYAGQFALKGPWSDINRAKADFESKLRDKTRGGYVELEIVYDEGDAEPAKPQKEEKKKGKKAESPKPSTLDRRVQDLIKLIFDLNMINKALAEIGYDAKKMPLGKLSQNNMRKGYEVLKRIEDALNAKNTSSLGALSGEFYTLIPHDFGFQHMSQFIINTKQRLKEKVDMLESLAEMKIATTILGVQSR